MATPNVSKDKYNMENNLRQLINIIEGRNPDIQYQDKEGEVIAMLQSYDSQSYTKLAQKVKRIEQLKEEIKALEDEVKQSTRDDITDLFDAEDAVKTRVVQTMSFILTLSKDPVATKTPKYKDILAVLSQQLTPELIKVLEGLKEQMVTVTQKAPSLKIRPLDEGFVNSLFARLKMAIMNWASRYDQKLAQLQQMAS